MVSASRMGFKANQVKLKAAVKNQAENQARLKGSDDVVRSYKVTHAKHKSYLSTGSDTLCNSIASINFLK